MAAGRSHLSAGDRRLPCLSVLPSANPNRRACSKRRSSPTRPGRALTRAPIIADYRRLTCSGRWPKRRLPPIIADATAPGDDWSADYRRLSPTRPSRLLTGAPITADYRRLPPTGPPWAPNGAPITADYRRLARLGRSRERRLSPTKAATLWLRCRQDQRKSNPSQGLPRRGLSARQDRTYCG